MRNSVFFAVALVMLISFSTCTLFGPNEITNDEPTGITSSVTPYSRVTLEDIENLDSRYNKLSDYDKAADLNDDLDLYLNFIQYTYDDVLFLFDQYLQGDAELYPGSRSIESTISVFVNDDEMTVESYQYDDNINYLTFFIDYFDVVLNGTTQSALAELIESDFDLSDNTSLLAEFSTFVKASGENNKRKAFSVYGYVESRSGADANPEISGMLNVSFGSRIFKTTDDNTVYAGKIYAQFGIKEFLDVNEEDFSEAVELITGLADSSSVVADWNEAVDLLWDGTSSPYLSLTLGVGDNDGIIETTTYTDLEVLEMIGNL